MLRDLKGTQRLPRCLAFKVTGTGTAAITEGGTDGTLVDNGTGDYTITYAKPFARTPVAVASTRTASTIIKLHAVSATVIQLKTYAVDGVTAQDALLDIMIHGWDSADQN